jgi:hypothetical protein
LFNQTHSCGFHRELFRLVWKRRSKAASHTPKIAAETVTLIREMAAMNRLWGAERIRGELLKLGIHVCKRTIQKYMRRVRSPQPRGQKWATFLRNHAAQVWACDFLQVTDLFFRPLAGVLHHRTQVEVSDPRGSDTISHRSMGCAYRSEKPRRMGKLPGISFVITIASLGPVSSEWHQRVPLKCSERLITLPEPMRSRSVKSGKRAERWWDKSESIFT